MPGSPDGHITCLSQRGWRSTSNLLRHASCRGLAKLRRSHSRLPSTIASQVNTRVRQPTAAARCSKSFCTRGSRMAYSWNHRSTPGTAATRSSSEVLDAVLRLKGKPRAVAARAR
ncbi:hypothetical protein D3C86_1916140 [compost metagenome]